MEEYENPQNKWIHCETLNKPHACPNCGSHDVGMVEAISGNDFVYKVQCRNCHLGGLYCGDMDWAVVDWNEHNWWTVRKDSKDKLVARLSAYDLKALSCPNCGSLNLNIMQHENGKVKIQCANCHVGGTYHKDTDNAVRWWNKRKWWKK